MSTVPIPQIIYDPGSGPVVLAFVQPPVQKQGEHDRVAVRQDSMTLYGERQSQWLRTDLYLSLNMEFVFQGSDLIAWKDFIDWALLGGSFMYYPDASDLTVASAYELVDTDWSPRFNFRTVSKFSIKMRKLPAPPGSIRQVAKLLHDVGGAQMFSNIVTLLGPTKPGNMIWAMIYFSDLNSGPNPSVTDDAGLTWTRVFYGPVMDRYFGHPSGTYGFGLAVFVATAGSTPTTRVTFSTGAGNRANSEMWVMELNIPGATSYAWDGQYATPPTPPPANFAACTADATTLSLQLHGNPQWSMFLVQFPAVEVPGATFWFAFEYGTIDFPTPPAPVFPPSGWSLVAGAPATRIICKGVFV
jgi:hypothetical protein